MIDYMKVYENKRVIVVVSVIVLLGVLFFINYFNSKQNGDDVVIPYMEENKAVGDTAQDAYGADDICVHVSGEVNVPGIVVLEFNSRVIDAVEAAGGLTADADISCVNLAFVVSDGMKICIPSIMDPPGSASNWLNLDAGPDVVQSADFSNSDVIRKVNINSASKAELESLNGIGSSTADRIIEYRRDNGGFNSVEELKNVSGIGNSKFDAIKSDIIVK